MEQKVGPSGAWGKDKSLAKLMKIKNEEASYQYQAWNEGSHYRFYNYCKDNGIG